MAFVVAAGILLVAMVGFLLAVGVVDTFTHAIVAPALDSRRAGSLAWRAMAVGGVFGAAFAADGALLWSVRGTFAADMLLALPVAPFVWILDPVTEADIRLVARVGTVLAAATGVVLATSYAWPRRLRAAFCGVIAVGWFVSWVRLVVLIAASA